MLSKETLNKLNKYIDYNTLVYLLKERNLLGRVLIPHRNKASKLLKKSAGPDIQVLNDLKYFLE